MVSLLLIKCWSAHLFSVLHMHTSINTWAVLSHFYRVGFFATQWTIAHQAPLSMGFSRQEYCSGLPCPPPGDLPDPAMEPTSPMSPALAGRFFTTSATWEKPQYQHMHRLKRNTEESLLHNLNKAAQDYFWGFFYLKFHRWLYLPCNI